MKLVVKITIATLLTLLVLSIGTFGLVRSFINDESVGTQESLFVRGEPKRMLVIFAHPDDEIVAAGTISKMANEPDSEVYLVFMTRGEQAGDAKWDIEKQQELARIRTAEAKSAGELLGAKETVLLNFRDSGLTPEGTTFTHPDGQEAVVQGTPAQEIKDAVVELIDRFDPTVILTFDDQVGFYGHKDHIVVGQIVREVVVNDGYRKNIKAFYQATLPKQMVDIALQLVSAFKEFYNQSGGGLPAPTVAINVSSKHRVKRELLDVHASQAETIADVQPGYKLMPSWIYYGIFEKEYFARVSLEG